MQLSLRNQERFTGGDDPKIEPFLPLWQFEDKTCAQGGLRSIKGLYLPDSSLKLRKFIDSQGV